MRYLVTMESVDSGDTPPPAEGAAILEAIVVPSLQTLKDWDDSGKIRGGTLTGRRGAPSSSTLRRTRSLVICCASCRSGPLRKSRLRLLIRSRTLSRPRVKP